MVWCFWFVCITNLCSHMLAGTLCINVHYLCFLLSPSGSDPERSSNDEPGPLPRNPTPSHQPHCQQDSHCQVSPVPTGHFERISCLRWLITWLTGLSANQNHAHTAELGSHLISAFDSVKSGSFFLEQNSQVIHRHQHTSLFRLRPCSCMHDVRWIIDHIH